MLEPPVAADSSSRRGGLTLSLLLASGLFIALFAEVVAPDLMPVGWEPRNFIFRDAGHFYYPYFKLISDQWGQGQVPLWNPSEDAGAPLAANPTASVFYPLKVLFALLPFGTAYRWYLLAHILVAWGACYWVGRRWGLSGWSAGFAGLSYAFSGFVFFQLYNVVFLIGAAWLPLGIYGVDRLVREPNWRWAIGLAVVLSLEVLGGDPQVAFLTILAAGPYLLWFHVGPRLAIATTAGLLLAGFGVVHADESAHALRTWYDRGSFKLLIGLPGASLALAVLGAMLLLFCRRRLWAIDGFRRSLRHFVVTGALSLLLTAVQVLTTIEFSSQTDRSARDAPHITIAFSLFPGRLLECVAPWIFGRQFPVNTVWAPFERWENGIWVPDLYMGLPTLVLAGFCLMGGSAWQKPEIRWLALLTLFFLWGSFGRFGGPLWLVDPNLGKPIDPLAHRPGESGYGTSDGLYRLAEETIPGFRSFRYPAKLFVFTTAGLALLAGFGLERLLDGDMELWRRRLGRLLIGCFVVASIAFSSVWISRVSITHFITQSNTPSSIFGPRDAGGAVRDFLQSMAHFGVVSGALAALLMAYSKQPARPWIVQIGASLLLTADLFVAARGLVVTDSQARIDARPELLHVIEAAEANKKEKEPYRVHRTRIFAPSWWFQSNSPERMLEVSRWERNTLQPKYAVPFGMEYTTVTGTMSLYDMEFFFAPWVVSTPAVILQQSPRTPKKMTYFPRVGYNLWNTKYFILPRNQPFDDEERGNFTLRTTAGGGACPVLAESPPDKEDYLVLENPECFPRAWIVHRADIRRPIVGLRRADRLLPMEQLLYRELDGGVPLWTGTRHGEYPLKSTAMIEIDDASPIAPYIGGGAPRPGESVQYRALSPTLVQMDAHLESPGLVVVSDAFFPGWRASVDGIAAPILRANRAMRAIPVPAGRHTVTMSYRSWRFEIGAVLSVVGWIAAVGFLAAGAFRR